MEKREGVKRVLITSIGGGKIEKKDGEKVLKDYEDTTYIIRKENGDFYTETTSCMPIVIKNAYDIDKTIIIGTTGSMWDNLYEKYLENLKLEEQKDEEYKKSLIDVEIASNKTMSLDKINLEKFNETFKDKVKGIVIKYGVNPKEIFRNFDLIIKIQEEFNEEEEYEVYLDITHSFRSNAFWMFLVMTYFTDVSNKNIKIAGITYGMYEAKSENVTPIVILKPFLEILNWIKGASELKQYGNSYYILENLKNNNNIPKEIKTELEIFSNTMNMNYIGALIESIDRLKNLKEQINEISGPAKHIVQEVLMNFIEDFDLKEDDNIKRIYLLQATLAKWHCEQRRYAMAAINISEAIVTFVLLALDTNSKKLKGKFDPDNDGQKWLKEVYRIYSDTSDLTDEEKQILKYGEIYVETVRIRKDVAHSLGKQVNINEDIKKLENYSNEIVSLLRKPEIIKEFEERLKILKNLKSKNSTEKLTIESKENTNKEIKKNMVSEKIVGKKILVISTRALDKNEIDELNVNWGFQKQNIIFLDAEETIKWKKAKQEEDFKYFKNKININLKEGDYILLHGDYFRIAKIKGYAGTYKIKSLIICDRFSPEDEYFKGI